MSVEIRSVVTGTVYQIEATSGDRVKSGDDLVILESMKMEIPIESSGSGTLREILVSEGDQVEQDSVVAVIGIS